MKTKIFIPLSFVVILFISLISCSPTYALTDNFSVILSPDEITQVVHPGNTYSLSITVETLDTTIEAFPISFSFVDQSFSVDNTWITFDQNHITVDNTSPTTLNFTLTIPKNTPIGEHFKAVGVSDIIYSEEESDNPPVVFAIPLTLQVTAVPEVSSTTNTETTVVTSTDSPQQTNNQQTNNQQTQASSNSPTKKNIIIKKSIPQTKINPDLHSVIKLVNLTSYFNPFNQTQTFKINLRNDGNISSTPTGTINLENLNGRSLIDAPINPFKLPIKPNNDALFTVTLNHQSLLGKLKATLWLGFQNTQTNIEPKNTATLYFLYMGKQPLILSLTTIVILALLFMNPLPSLRSRLRFFCFPLLFFSMGVLVFDFRNSQLSSSKFLGVSTNMAVNATVKDSIAKVIVTADATKIIQLVGTNPSQLVVYSLQSSVLQPIDLKVATTTILNAVLNKKVSRFPILIITRRF